MIDYSMGWLHDFNDPNDYDLDHPAVEPFLLKCKDFGDFEGIVLPEQYDIDSYADLPAIRNQQTIGACTGFAARSMYGTFVKVLEKNPKNKIIFEDLSPMFLYKIERNLLGFKGDTGAYLRTALQALNKFGFCLEKYWSYDIARYDDEPTPFCYKIAENYQALIYYKLDNRDPEKFINSIKLNLVANRACVLGFTVFSNLQRNGDVLLPGWGDKVRGGHAIGITAFDNKRKVGKSIGAFKFPNSWDITWGEKGYGWLPYDYFRKGLASDCWTINKAEWIGQGFEN
jgi:C1A family cysteine protease